MATTKKTKAPAKQTETQAAPGAQPAATQGRKRTAVGVVVSNKMQKTIVVKVDRRVRDSLYAKYVVRSRRFKAHDEKNEANPGDRVLLVESRPLSRDKRWVLQSILRKAGQAMEANV